MKRLNLVADIVADSDAVIRKAKFVGWTDGQIEQKTLPQLTQAMCAGLQLSGISISNVRVRRYRARRAYQRLRPALGLSRSTGQRRQRDLGSARAGQALQVATQPAAHEPETWCLVRMENNMQYDPEDHIFGEQTPEKVLRATTKKGDVLTIRRVRGRFNYFQCHDQRGEWYGDSQGTSEAALRNFKRKISDYFGGVGRWRVEDKEAA